MKTTVRITVFVLSLAFMSCGKSAQDEHQHHDHAAGDAANTGGDVLQQEVDHAHNEAMAKMGEIRRLRTELNKKAALPDVSAEKKAGLQAAVVKLDSAYNNMMDWMHQYNPDEPTSDEARHKYFETELEKIKKVQSDISAAIEKAKEF